MDYKINKQELKENGWTLIKSVFSESEISKMREAVRMKKTSSNTGDLMSDPRLSKVLTDERIMSIVSEMLGEKPLYFGDSTATMHSVDKSISHGFHKDSADRFDQEAPDFQGEYSIIRIGIYLQDHSKHSQGLIVRNGSHKRANYTSGKPVIVPSEPGDVIVWYLTTTHSGNAKRLRFSNVVLADDGSNKFLKQLYYRVPDFNVLPEESDRMALFMSFASKGTCLDRYIQYLKGRNYSLDMWRNSNWNLIEIVKEVNESLEFIDMPSFIKEKGKDLIGGSTYELPY